MKFPVRSASRNAVVEGTALAALCGLAYYAAFFLQAQISPFVTYTQGVDLFFAPAGIKLVAFMTAGIWGFWGIAIFGLVTAFDVWRGDSILVHLGNIIVWAGVPYLTYRLLARLLGLDSGLRNLQYWHVVVIATVTTLTSSLGSNVYQWLIQNRSADMLTGASMAMAIGDFLGIGLFVFGLAFLVKIRRH